MTDVKLHELSVDQTLRWRALELACATSRELRFSDSGYEDQTCDIIDRASVFMRYVEDGDLPERSTKNPGDDA